MNDDFTAKPPPLSESLVREYGFKPEALPVLRQARSISIGQIRALIAPEVLADFSGLLPALDKAIGFLGSRGISVNLGEGPQRLWVPKVQPSVNGQAVNGGGKPVQTGKSRRERWLRPLSMCMAESDKDGAMRNDLDIDPIRQYLDSIGSIPRITPQEEIELARRIKKGDESAREKMITANLRLVVVIAKKYRNLGLPFLELINEGNIGLMKGVERFEPGKGAKLSTYASWWIKQSIRRALAEQGRTIRLPVHMVDKMASMRRVVSMLFQELERAPTDEEVAAELGVTAERVRDMQSAYVQPARLDSPLGDESDSTLADVIPDTRASDPAKKSEHQSEIDQIPRLIGELSERERRILVLRFGIDDGGDGMTLEEVGAIFGITRERVRQLEWAALRKLRARVEGRLYVRTPKKKRIKTTV
jgi:RNA polymerase primary sigma factor